MTVFITAVGGFLGSRLAASFAARGYLVKGSVRRRSGCTDPNVSRLVLGERFRSSVFAECDVLIHAAHDFTRGAAAINVEGTIAWAEAAASAGVTRQVFISSPSAQPDAPSEYGHVKYLLERWFLAAGHLVVRPGLVIGPGGLFGRQRTAVLRSPVVPLVGRGNQPTLVIAVDHFLDATARLVERGSPRGARLYYDDPLPMRAFVTALNQAAGRRTRIVTIPPAVAIGLAGIAGALRLPVPVTAEQIRTLLRSAPPPASDLPELLPDRAHEFSLAYALAAMERVGS